MKSIIQDKKECFRTHSIIDLDKHHIMNGNAYRNKSEKYGLWVWLNHDVHMWLHNTRDGNVYARELKAIAQEHFEELYGHTKWLMLFHKNYL